MGLYNLNIMSRKSAYQYAIEGGYNGTEDEFTELLGNLDSIYNDFYTSEQVDTLLQAKTSINDNTASAITTYSSNKIKEVINSSIENMQPTTKITIKTWSSSDIT